VRSHTLLMKSSHGREVQRTCSMPRTCIALGEKQLAKCQRISEGIRELPRESQLRWETHGKKEGSNLWCERVFGRGYIRDGSNSSYIFGWGKPISCLV
jgi:hypothetical protein